MQLLFTSLFILGCLFSIASRGLDSTKPSHPRSKVYGTVSVIIWILLFVLANTIL